MTNTINEIDKKNNQIETGKHLTFSLGTETYGIDVLKIKEIIGVINITVVPRMPDFIKGVINLRGKIIPVIDLRLKIGFEFREYDERTCIIIVEILINNDIIMLGVIIDTVLEVVNITEENLEPAPNFGMKINTSFISGMAKIESKVIALLNIEELLSTEDIEKIRTTDNNLINI